VPTHTFALLAAAVVAVVVAVPLAAQPDAGTARTETFTDPAGDSGPIPDITLVTLANDDAGLLTFTIAIGNRTELAEGEFIQMFLDTDADNATGDGNGMDYGVQIGGAAGPGILARWTGAGTGFGGSGYTTIERSRTFTASWSGGPRFTVSQAEIGEPARMHFFVRAARQGGQDLDDAPDGDDLWEYVLDIPLLFERFTLNPDLPRAGRTLHASLEVRTNTDKPLPVRCQAKLAGKPLRGRGSWMSVLEVGSSKLGANLFCDWKLPRTAKGKLLTGSISATNDGVTVTRTFSRRVR
jgi:hypothetical protein